MPFFLLFIILFISSCTTTEANPPPAWIEEPGAGVVGHSRMNIKGRAHQILVATARARDELAARQGVIINSEQTLAEKVKNNSANTSLTRNSQQEIKSKTVMAKVIDEWCHPKTHECWVWLMPNSANYTPK